MALGSNNPFPSILVVEGSAPSSPASGNQRAYIDSADHHLKRKNSSGTVTDLENLPGTLLAVHEYAPATTVFSTTSTSMVDVDATNMAITFTAPASGNVLVKMSAFTDETGSAADTYWGLRESTTNLKAGKTIRSAAGEGPACSMSFYLTGISAGSHTYKWAYGSGNAGCTARIIVGPGAAIGDWQSGLMEVWAA